MANCLQCGNPIPMGARSHAKYCSGNCRTKAYHKRKIAERRIMATQLDMFALEDLKLLAKVSDKASDFIMRVAAVCGKDMAEDMIDAMWDLAAKCGVDFEQYRAH